MKTWSYLGVPVSEVVYFTGGGEEKFTVYHTARYSDDPTPILVVTI